MVSIKNVRASNATFKDLKQPGLVFVSVGGTSGIGLGTLKAFSKNATSPTVYIVGRSKKAATPLLNELQASNPDGTFIFRETEVSLIKNVDAVCEEIKEKEKKVDVLFLSCGYLDLGGRDESSEGIHIPLALTYYTRLRFVHNLLPLLTASPTPRVISILAGGRESPIDLTDLEVRNNFSGLKAIGNGTTQTTLAFEELAKSHPTITFIHKYPGFVSTGVIERLLNLQKGLLAIPATFAKYLVMPILNLFASSLEEAGERGLFLATSARYPASVVREGTEGTKIPEGVVLAKPSIIKDGKGNGVYLLGASDETVDNTEAIIGYRAEGAGKVVWEGSLAVWDRAVGRA